MKKVHMHRGMTLVETCIALVLMSFVMIIAVNLLGLTARGLWGTNLQITVAREDSAFAARLNDTIQKSTTAFTIPRASFKESKLTAGWHYLGLMDDVRIPAKVSRTGSEISSAQALVYISYVGTTAPASVPEDCNLLSNADGYFLQKILGHAFTDPDGLDYSYSLVFKPTDPVNTAAQTVIYDFSSEITDASGNPVGSGKGVDIDTMLNALNSIQVVYKGSTFNPAVALAFHTDFLPTYSVVEQKEQPAATVLMVLDLSASMILPLENSNISRLSGLKAAATEFVEKLSVNERVNVILMPFADYAADPFCYKDAKRPNSFIYNAYNDKEKLINDIELLRASGETNMGDGLRLTYHVLKTHEKSGADVGLKILILISDGESNRYSLKNRWYNLYDYPPLSFFYTGANYKPSHIYVNFPWIHGRNPSLEYVTLWVNKFRSEYNDLSTYLVKIGESYSGSEEREVLERLFDTSTVDIKSLTEFQNVFAKVYDDVQSAMWAFEGPRL